jgi:hypothetical protein
MSTTLSATASPPSQEALRAHFLPAMRQRFKAEVNRMTGGAMAALLGNRPDAQDLTFLLTYLYAFHWLRENVHEAYRQAVLSPFRGPSRAFLMDLLEQSPDASAFVRGYLRHWLDAPADSPVQREQLLRLLAAQQNDPKRLEQELLQTWEGLRLFTKTRAQWYSELGHEERDRYREMLGDADRERLALVDALPAPAATSEPFAKLGLIPAMGCPQTCRHCMFIWRPPMRNLPDPDPLFRIVDRHTDSVLFTGGDLTRHLEVFYRAIRGMAHIRTFAILLNGDFADDMAVTHKTLEAMESAIETRPRHWPKARVLLQISFDELHQEVLFDRNGRLKERIPIAKIANVVECAPRYPAIQLCLVHKQNALNFSMDLFRRGVFGRLLEELGRRGHQVQILSTVPSPRLKRNPLDPAQTGRVLKDASFVLPRYPDSPVLLTSSTIDAYGRAALLDEGEAVKERELLQQLLRNGPPAGEAFDTDLMFWANGWVTLFSAVHICLGDIYGDGEERILERHRKDPLTAALKVFDRRLLKYYGEIRPDLEQRITAATGPHHLFHMLTEDAGVRLHMTRRLVGSSIT